MQKTMNRFLLPALIGAGSWMTTPLGAQEAAADNRAATSQAEPARVVSIRFRGGPLSKFLDQLLDENEGLNVIASEIAEEVPLPAFEIFGAAPETVLQGVTRIVPEPYRAQVSRLGGEGNEVFSLRVDKANLNPTGVTVGAPARVAVFSLRSMLGSDQLNEALAAIDAGLGVADGTKPKVRFHEGSGLLFVHGNSDQLNLVQQILVVIDSEPLAEPGDNKSGGSGR